MAEDVSVGSPCACHPPTHASAAECNRWGGPSFPRRGKASSPRPTRPPLRVESFSVCHEGMEGRRLNPVTSCSCRGDGAVSSHSASPLHVSSDTRTFHSPVEPDDRRHLTTATTRVGCRGLCALVAGSRDVGAGAPGCRTAGRLNSIVAEGGGGVGGGGRVSLTCGIVVTPESPRAEVASDANRIDIDHGGSTKGCPRLCQKGAISWCGSLVAFLLFLSSLGIASSARNYRFSTNNVTALLDGLLAKDHYDYRIRPDFGGPPVLVTVNMHIKSMGPVSEMDELYVMDCYFRQVWYDRRLSFNFSGLTEFSMSWLFLERIWKPDTFFTNGKKSYLHRITVPNKFIRLRNDGFLTYSMRLTILARCKMHLRKFPLDSQACPLFIGSYGYNSKDVLYQWAKGSVGLEPGVELAQYDLVSISTEGEAMERRGNDSYSVIRVFFFLKRHTGYFMLQVYVPCGLIVSCSWVSFWIDPDAVPARVSLGVTTVLSMTTMGFGGRAQMPKVSYATALDWFVILCFSFVFAVMVEYAAINFIDKIRTDVKRKVEEEKKKREEKERAEEAAAAAAEAEAGEKERRRGEEEEEEDEEERKKRRKREGGVEIGGGKDHVMGAHDKRPTNFGPSNVLLGGVGEHDVVRVIVESVDEDPVTQKAMQDVPPPVPPPPVPPPPPPTVGGGGRGGLGGGLAGGVGARAGVGHVVRDNIDWDEEADEYDEYTDDELDVVNNGAGPEDVVEMAVSDSADRLGVGCDSDIGRTANLRRARSVTASPVDTPGKWQQTLLAPIKAIRSSRMFTKDEFGSVMMFLGVDQSPNGRVPEGSEALVPAGKFSKIDITSRKAFPILFLTLLSIYWVSYMYYITDEYQAEGWHTTGDDGIGPRRNVVFVAGENN